MPRKRRARRIPTPSWERERGVIGRRFFGRSLQVYGTAAVVLLIVAGIALVGFAFGSDYIQDRQRPGSTAIRVGETEFTVEYYANRMKSYIAQFGGAEQLQQQPQLLTFVLTNVSDTIIGEAIILQSAAAEEVSASDDDLAQKIAETIGITPEDATYNSRLQEEVQKSGLTEDQYKDMIRAEVLRQKLVEKFTAALPATAESVHFRQIQVASQAEAEDIREQVEAGADFAEIAKQKDESAQETGGDQGWVPRGYLDDASQEDAIFALEPGELLTFPTESGAFVFQLIEKQADRPLDEDKKPKLAQIDLADWLAEKRAQLSIVNNMDPSSGDSDKIEYAVKQALAA